jgi:hypothetical protein
VISAVFIRGVTAKENISGVSGFISDFKDGLGLVRDNQVLRNLALLAGVALPVGQLSNAILSSFIHDDLGRGSEVFGLVDAAWPVGGMMAAMVLGSNFLKINRRNMEYVFAILVGVVTVVFLTALQWQLCFFACPDGVYGMDMSNCYRQSNSSNMYQ